MLIRDGNRWILPADPRAVDRISRVSRVLGIICAFIGGWALLCGLGVLIVGGVLFAAISTAGPGSTATARWGIGGGLVVCGIVFAGAGVVLLVRDRKLQSNRRAPVLTVDGRGVTIAGMGFVTYADLVSVRARIGPRPVLWSTSFGKTAGNELGAKMTGRPRIVHELNIRRRSGPDIRADLSMHTNAAGFTRLVAQLRDLLAPCSVPVEFHS
ncbi:MAG: hypothetical protein L0G69_09110 [Brevibacterium sp.]|nr:hypothetical protein [Brevibacterium sp.]